MNRNNIIVGFEIPGEEEEEENNKINYTYSSVGFEIPGEEEISNDGTNEDNKKDDSNKDNSDENNSDENKTDENNSDENNSDENKTDENKTDENKTDENKTDESKDLKIVNNLELDKQKSDLEDSQKLESLGNDLTELDEILNSALDNEKDGDDSNNDEVFTKLQEASKIIQKLKKENSELQLEKAEMLKFGEDYTLPDGVVIIKNYYTDALKGDQTAINKIKEIISMDFGLEVTNPKKTFFSDDIKSDTSFNNTNNSTDDMFGFPV